MLLWVLLSPKLLLVDSFVLVAELLDYLSHSFVELCWHLKCVEGVYIEATFGLAEVHFVVELSYHDLLVLLRIEPFNTLAFLPETEFYLLRRHQVSA